MFSEMGTVVSRYEPCRLDEVLLLPLVALSHHSEITPCYSINWSTLLYFPAVLCPAHLLQASSHAVFPCVVLHSAWGDSEDPFLPRRCNDLHAYCLLPHWPCPYCQPFLYLLGLLHSLLTSEGCYVLVFSNLHMKCAEFSYTNTHMYFLLHFDLFSAWLSLPWIWSSPPTNMYPWSATDLPVFLFELASPLAVLFRLPLECSAFWLPSVAPLRSPTRMEILLLSWTWYCQGLWWARIPFTRGGYGWVLMQI